MYGLISEAGSVFLKPETSWDPGSLTDAPLLRRMLSFTSSQIKASASVN